VIYVPAAFKQSEHDVLHALIESFAFATLISPDAEDPTITHLPLLLDRARGANGTLIGHVARGNPQWRKMQERPGILAIFHGPHAYVSPSWYGVHPSVPTWNYAVVHARGTARLIEDAAALEAIVRRLVETYENSRAVPWRMALPEEYQRGMIGGIVGFEIEIAELTGKFKLSQNRTAADRRKVVDALEAGGAEERQVGALMRARVLGNGG
jgi:transcriptional regulator